MLIGSLIALLMVVVAVAFKLSIEKANYFRRLDLIERENSDLREDKMKLEENNRKSQAEITQQYIKELEKLKNEHNRIQKNLKEENEWFRRKVYHH
jgi:phage host-nuclease inhibitor protein Gam